MTEAQIRLREKKRLYDQKRYRANSIRAKWGSAEHKENLTKWGWHRRKAAGHSAMTRTFGMYRWNAKAKGVPFTLTREEFAALIIKPCHYCGAEAQRMLPHRDLWSTIKCNGLDRVDNEKGYTLENAVPCCRTCNIAKRDLSLSEFLDWAERIHLHQKELQG